MKKNIILILKGIIIGIAKIIPGVSGAVIALSFGLYDRGLNAITHFFDNLKNNFSFLLSVGSGIVIGIILFSKIISFTLEKYHFLTMSLFIGLIIGGIPSIIKKTNLNLSNIVIFFLSFFIIIFLGFTNGTNQYILTNTDKDLIIFFFSGIIEAIATVIPGVSSTALLMLIGTYNLYITTIGNLTDIYSILTNLRFLSCFAIGLFLGIIIVSLIMDYLFKKHSSKIFSAVLGIIIATILLLILSNFSTAPKIIELIIGIILLVLGITISFLFES